jgi:hypothetical protein
MCVRVCTGRMHARTVRFACAFVFICTCTGGARSTAVYISPHKHTVLLYLIHSPFVPTHVLESRERPACIEYELLFH